MSENSWSEKDGYSIEEACSLLSDKPAVSVDKHPLLASTGCAASTGCGAFQTCQDTQRDASVETSVEYRGYSGRRRKAAVLLIVIWSGTIALHLFSWGVGFVVGMTAIMSIHAVRVLTAQRLLVPKPLSDEPLCEWPYVSLLVAAKNEEAVIGRLVQMLCNQDYPSERYEVWVIDDYSTDSTALVLSSMQTKYDQLKVLRRAANATGGKSGALNQVLPLTKGEVLAVFDADAQVMPDMLKRVLPMFQRSQVGAVQMRKAIANEGVNFWTRGQSAEMGLDSYFQQQRTAIRGIGELRGNGQFVRREAMYSCGGWNEETITDDLDLTIRLHLNQWDIEFMLEPAVLEEGVTSALSLWHQRNRWSEGGYQRYLDYWRLIFSNRMGWRKTWDMFMFWMIQYFLPNAALPDCLMAIARNRLPVLSPMTALMLGMSLVAMFTGLRRISKESGECASLRKILVTSLQTMRGSLYMLHWLLIVASTAARISVRPKRLKWVKTIHQGTGEESFEF
ncbi:MAG: glycosyltransferase family 2 protein [Hormoscilla sp. GM102CHS1]|nr:glycosyltransferase family 2 protein [Hormoscilla sp. GM102CHS1]